MDEEKDMKLYKGFLLALLTGMLLMGLSACAEKGTAEKAGESIDNAVSDIKKSSDDAIESVKKEIDD